MSAEFPELRAPVSEFNIANIEVYAKILGGRAVPELVENPCIIPGED